mgnify:CR=1 FL=1
MNKKKVSSHTLVFLSILVVVSLLGLGLISFFTPEAYSYELSNFESYDELYTFLKKQGSDDSAYYAYDGFSRILSSSDSLNAESMAGGETDDASVSYSETNIQVEGVDEPDSVKTDGTYIYLLDEQTIFIVKSYPASSFQVESKIFLSDEYYYASFFVREDSLIVFGRSHPTYHYYTEPAIIEKEVVDTSDDEQIYEENVSKIVPPEPGEWSVGQTALFVYDISDRSNPNLAKSIEIDGSFVDARLIENMVYMVASESTYDVYRVVDGVDYLQVPTIRVDGNEKNISAEQVYYVDEPDETNSLTHILALNIDSLTHTEKSFLIGNTQELYMSKNNIYLVYTSYEYTPAVFGSSQFDMDAEITKIHKIHVEGEKISFVGSGEVSGRLLNQFSMDEHDSYFRIATTTGYIWNEDQPSQNHVYVLDENLNTVSSINDIAPGEELYAARFMGDTAYLVTFKNTDPFFTIDLSDPLNPEVLGELKLPGYSDYLHPYDEHHIIGIGKDTVASDDPNFAWYQGVKLAMFNVSDIDNPVLVDTEVIGDRGSSTPVLSDHKALLFDKNKQLLSLPVSVYEISDEDKKEYENDPGTYGSFQYQGAYVFKVTTEGFSFRNRITHLNQSSLNGLQDHSWYHGSDERFIHRTLYIDNVLYTLSKSMIQAHALDDLSFVNQVALED